VGSVQGNLLVAVCVQEAAVMKTRAVRKEPKPCNEFRNVDAVKFIRHVNEDKCPQCTVLLRYLEQQSRLDQLLRENRN
jgi:hypothetical protein